MQLWTRPWVLLDRTGRRSRVLAPGAPVQHEGCGAVWAYAVADAGTAAGGRHNGGLCDIEAGNGMAIHAMPLPRPRTTLDFAIPGGLARLSLPDIPDRPAEGHDATPEATTLLERVKSVWARLRDVEGALADPARIWPRLAEAWLGAQAAADPEMDRIVQHARDLPPTLDLLDRAPRRILRRTQRMIPLARVQEMDRNSMTWLIRQPGETMAERAGDRQRIRAVAREENFNTLENRVVLSYAALAADVARAYRERHGDSMRQAPRVRRVIAYGARCRHLEQNFRDHGVFPAGTDATPNYVLQNNANYRSIWQAWQDLLRRGRILDELWRWQSRSWEEFCALAVIVALHELPGARAIAVSPLVYREEQQAGCWLSHINPLAVIHLPAAGIVIEVSYRPSTGRVRSPFGAPIWLRLGRIGSDAFLVRWAVWPLWDALGGLEPGEAAEIAALCPAGAGERVVGGITLRPVRAGEPVAADAIPGATCLTLGASGPALGDGIRRLASVLGVQVVGSAG